MDEPRPAAETSVSQLLLPISDRAQGPLRTTITSLPGELLLEIVKQIRPYSMSYQKQYYNLCLVKPFRRVATEFLYHNLLDYKYNLVALLRTVLLRPELAALIRSLRLDAYRMVEEPPKGMTAEDIKMFIKATKSLGLGPHYERLWVALINEVCESHSVLCALLLLHAANITRLSTDSDEWSTIRFGPDIYGNNELPYWAAGFSRDGDQPRIRARPAYLKLKDITIHEYDVDVSHISPFFNMQGLERLDVSGLREDGPRLTWKWDPTDFAEGQSNISSLTIYVHPDQNFIHPEALAHLLLACRRLEEFSYSSFRGGYGPGSLGRKIGDLSPTNNALGRHKNSLRSIELYNLGINIWQNHWTPVLRLSEMASLEHVHVDAELLFGSLQPWPQLSSLLPSLVKKIRLDNFWMALFRQFLLPDSILSDMRGKESSALPMLKQLALGIDWDLSEPDDPVARILQEDMGDRNVHCFVFDERELPEKGL